MKFGTILLVVVSVVILVAVGTRIWKAMRERDAATKVVLEALNSKEVSFQNGQIALLHSQSGYAALVPSLKPGYHLDYKIYFSTNGSFSASATPMLEGSAEKDETKSIVAEDARANLRMGDSGELILALEFRDTSTGLAVWPTTDLARLDATKIKFLTNQTFNENDLGKALGLIK